MTRGSSQGSGGTASSAQCKYKYTAAYIEDNSSDAQATYGVQFCLRPSKFHIRGGGSVWPGRGPLQPVNRSNAANESDEMDVAAEPAPTSNSADETVRTREDQAHKEVDADAEVVEVGVGGSGPWRNVFATCNNYTVRVYEARHKEKPVLLQVFEDGDKNEQFYCVGWTYNADGNHQWWLCAAGKKGVLRVINVQEQTWHKSIIGHGEAINDLKVHPRDSSLVITASKDESLRLWNLRTGSTVAVFAGLKGHRGEVVHVDFDRDGRRFASCGIDNSVRIWEVNQNAKVMAAIKESHMAADLGVEDTYVFRDETGTRKRTVVPICQFPCFVTRKVHKHYVDCVMWVGDLLLSKSVHNRIFLWEPEADRESLASPASNFTLLEEYVLEICNVWFIRFAMDKNRRLVACGNDKGIVTIFDLDTIPTKPMCVVQPKEKFRYSPQFVRQCAFSEDGSILLAVDDTSTISQYERV